ncbi:MAG: ribonuclease HI family protein [Candidatus Krumholzibacteriia bacterium]
MLQEPQTLAELLRALERSDDLRSLARECGLTARELRRRLAVWRRDLAADDQRAGSGRDAGEGASSDVAPAPAGTADPWPELPDADALATSPLPGSGSRILAIHTDGASKGNPGPAAIGAVFRQKDGPLLCGLSRAIGHATNNSAEYRAVIAALELCSRWKVRRVHLHVDSELVARQLQGQYRVKSVDLRPLYQRVVHLARDLQVFRVQHVPREQNAHADHLANLALRRASNPR